MRITRDTEKTFTLAARPTMTPSKWLLRFVKVDNEALYQLCIADSVTVTGRPVLLTFTEVDTSPDPLVGEVTLPPGQWQLYVYEQTSTTNLNWTLADREVHDVLVEVVGEETATPDPTNPCEGAGSCDVDVIVTVNGVAEPSFELDPCEANTINIAVTVS